MQKIQDSVLYYLALENISTHGPVANKIVNIKLMKIKQRKIDMWKINENGITKSVEYTEKSKEIYVYIDHRENWSVFINHISISVCRWSTRKRHRFSSSRMDICFHYWLALRILPLWRNRGSPVRTMVFPCWEQSRQTQINFNGWKEIYWIWYRRRWR